MFAFTTNQWVIIALVFILGWLFGLFTLSGNRRWKPDFERERTLRIAAEEQNDRLSAKLTELEGERDRRSELEREREHHAARAAAASERIAELEKRRPAINADTAGTIAAAASGQRDDLARIFGVGRGGEIRLNELGIHRYADIVALSPTEEAELEGRMGIAPGAIADERWREQAEILRKGDVDEHARRFA
ncbi:hypothetical protein [Rhizorhabdus wittichii]|jgi:predicted flap endonuclease-1-like 5' DNA nuclease|uniref:Uncharacterized protein n=2 Tax=Rhizorhabdus wittichii TaxID=160791 RepID=A0A9J9HGD3_RHIWR|nr:hypothetical protein [Rhizorhabdus wittichii]ABQ71200.1 hypothetical protein Swit_4863 [Rhizorhabdus wittichii RW1]ARR51972.1 hypothetical protein HY78_00110 [Rhizorhabdus wittichii DC-6]QTH22274.1 hypothetical protein HRJ34_01700 [Rhizorhabdus wittichii]